MTDFALARRNMIEGQLRPNRVTNAALLGAIAELPRERFLPEGLRAVAYADDDVPLGGGRYMMEPMVLALLKTDRNAVRGLQQFIGQSPWPTEPLLLKHQARVAAALGEPAAVVIVDGSGFPKDGPESVGVAPQYCESSASHGWV